MVCVKFAIKAYIVTKEISFLYSFCWLDQVQRVFTEAHERVILRSFLAFFYQFKETQFLLSTVLKLSGYFWTGGGLIPGIERNQVHIQLAMSDIMLIDFSSPADSCRIVCVLEMWLTNKGVLPPHTTYDDDNSVPEFINPVFAKTSQKLDL